MEKFNAKYKCEIYVVVLGRDTKDVYKYVELLKNAVIVKTTDKENFKQLISLFPLPSLIIYNEHSVPIKIYINIAKKPPIIVPNLLEKLAPLLSSFRTVPLISPDSVNYISLWHNSKIINDKLYIVDEFLMKLFAIDIKTGIMQSSLNLNTINIRYAALEPEYWKDEYVSLRDLTTGKLYGMGYSKDSIYAILHSTVKFENTIEYIEELDDTLETINCVPGKAFISIDTNFKVNIVERFYSCDVEKRINHSFFWDFYIYDTTIVFHIFPNDDFNLDIDTAHLLAIKNDKSRNCTAIYPYFNNSNSISVKDFWYSSMAIKINSENIFIANAKLNVFSTISRTDYSQKKNYQFNGILELARNKNIYEKHDERIGISNDIVNYQFIDELNDSIIIIGTVFIGDTIKDYYSLLIQKYNKDGTFILEKSYNISDLQMLDYSCIYKNELVFVFKKDNKYSLGFIPIK